MTHRLAEKALQESRSFGVRRIPTLRPLGWLARGWKDLVHCPLPGLAHGLILALLAGLLLLAGRHRFWLLASAGSAFLLVAPILATGLYAVSRSLDKGERPTLNTAFSVWVARDGRLIVFGLLLAFAGLGWVMTSASLITGFAGGQVDTPADFLRQVVLAEEGHLFESWLGLGALLAAPVFASSVVAIPLMLDRHVGVLGAVFTSWRVVMEHPAPMALWAGLLMFLTGIGLVSMGFGLIFIVPWLAHSSWHVYRDTVDTSGLSERG